MSKIEEKSEEKVLTPQEQVQETQGLAEQAQAAEVQTQTAQATGSEPQEEGSQTAAAQPQNVQVETAQEPATQAAHAEPAETTPKIKAKPQHPLLKEKLKVKRAGCVHIFYSKTTQISDEMLTSYQTSEELAQTEEFAKEALVEAEESTKKRKHKKTKIMSACFLILNLAIIAIIIITQSLSDDSMASIGDMFAVANFWYLLGAIAAFALLMAADSFRYWALIFRSTKISRPFLSYKVMATGRYYDSITPLSTGGQPFQIYYMTKRGIKGSTASSVPFALYIFNQLVTALVSVSVLIFSKKIAGGLDPTVYTAAVIGVILNTAIMVFIFFLSFSKKIAPTLTIWGLKLLHKMHIVKNYTALFRKVMRFVNEYQKTFRYFMSNIFVMLEMLLSTFLVTCLRFLIPACVVCMFNGGQLDWDTYAAVFIWCVLIESVLSYIPWPGAAGVAEITYVTMFYYFDLSAGTVVWAMLIYRVFQYYMYLIQGLGVMAYDVLHGNKKIEKTKARIARIEAERLQAANPKQS